MTAPTIYRSSDASAPVLTGTAGDLVNLLDKCLVLGYGAKANAGWSRKTAFAGNTTTRAAFQQGGGNQLYLDVDDRGATGVLTGATGKEAAVRGYEAMTDVSTGTNPFPTTAQIAAATGNWRKSATADAVPRGWFLVADDRTFMLAVLDGDTLGTYKVYYFGDIYSLKTGDSYRTGILTRSSVNGASSNGTIGTAVATAISSSSTLGWYLARIAAATGTSANPSLIVIGSSWETAVTFAGSLDGNIYLQRVLTSDAASGTILRGWLRGVYEILQPIGLADGDTFDGAGDFAGRSFIVVKGFGGSTLQAMAIETTAWDTSS